MAFEITVAGERTFEVAASPEAALALVGDVPRSGGHFPKVESLVAVDGAASVYRWRLAPMGPKKYGVQANYQCAYVVDDDQRTVTWVPHGSGDNAVVDGSWRVSAVGSGSRLVLTTSMTLTLPFSRMIRKLAAPIVDREFSGLLDRYVAAIAETLNA